jgi:hypothetical protein
VIILRIDNRAHLSLSHLPVGAAGQLKERLTFANPVYLENKRKRSGPRLAVGLGKETCEAENEQGR